MIKFEHNLGKRLLANDYLLMNVRLYALLKAKAGLKGECLAPGLSLG